MGTVIARARPSTPRAQTPAAEHVSSEGDPDPDPDEDIDAVASANVSQRPSNTATDLKLQILKGMFPQLDSETITMVLEANDGDISKTAEMFLPSVRNETQEQQQRRVAPATTSHECAPVAEVQTIFGWANSAEQDARLQAARALADLTMTGANLGPLVSQGAVAVVAALLADTQTVEVRTHAAIACANLALDDQGQAAVASSSSVSLLLALTSVPGCNTQARLAVARALANLAYENGSSHNQMIQAGALAPLVAMTGDSSEDVQCEACAALANLAMQEANQEAIVLAGALPPLCQLLRSSSVEVHRQAARAIANLSIHEGNKAAIVKAGVLRPLVFVSLMASPPVQRLAAMALANLSSREELQEQIVLGGALPPIFALLHGENKEAQRQAARALANLSENENNKHAIMQHGGLRQFLSLARSETVEMQLLAARCLANLSTVQGAASSWG